MNTLHAGHASTAFYKNTAKGRTLPKSLLQSRRIVARTFGKNITENPLEQGYNRQENLKATTAAKNYYNYTDR